MSNKRIVLTGGGSGGHINPLAAVAEELQKQATDKNIPLELYFIGHSGGFFKPLIDLNIKIYDIAGSKVRRYFSLANFLEFPKFIAGVIEATWRIFWIMPDAVFSKGGSGSIATILAARFFRIPVFIHETDSMPSATTRFTAPFSSLIFTSFEITKKHLARKYEGIVELVGNPLRKSFLLESRDRREAKIALNFNPDKPLVVVVGGSQGSVRINNLILASLKNLLASNIQFFHQVGEKNVGDMQQSLKYFFKTEAEMLSSGYKMAGFVEASKMAVIMAAADIIVSRAGGSMFEFAAMGRASILIPLPESASNHQKFNAEACSEIGACVMLEEAIISVPLFEETVLKYIKSPAKENMESAALKFARVDASLKIAEKLLESVSD